MTAEERDLGVCGERLRELLGGSPFATRVIALAETTSTNDALRERAAGGAEEGSIVVSGRQTAGRGRHGREWHSPPGLGLYLSMLFRPAGRIEHVTRWTLAAAVAACEACRRSVGASVAIEWPNDLVGPDGKKLGGILAEMRTGHVPGGRELILGVGINVSHLGTDFPPELRDHATSLTLLGGGDVERERLAADLVLGLGRVGRQLEDGDWDAVRHRWQELAVGAFGRRVRVRREGARSAGRAFYEGVTEGLDESGALLVKLEGGSIEVARLTDSVESRESRSCC